jgi:ABC-type transport system involved in multi-copper enzyme maturation permease subunit
MTQFLSLLRLFGRLFLRRRLPRYGAVLCLLPAFYLASRTVTGDGQASGFAPLSEALLAFVYTLIPFGALLGAVAISDDYQRGSLRSIWTRPVRGGQVFLAQAAVLTLWTLALTAVGLIGCTLIASRAGFGSVMVEGLEVLTKAEIMTVFEQLRMLPLLPILAAPIVGLCISSIQRDSSSAVALSLIVVLGPTILSMFLSTMPVFGLLGLAAKPIMILKQFSEGITLDGGLVDSGSLQNRILLIGGMWFVVPFLLGATALDARELRA